jgi:tryptophan synthase alpha subunit
LLCLCLVGLLVPDLPLEETDAIRAACVKAGLELVLLTTPTTPQSRMAEIARASQGFVYLVSVTGEAAAAAMQARSGMMGAVPQEQAGA